MFKKENKKSIKINKSQKKFSELKEKKTSGHFLASQIV